MGKKRSRSSSSSSSSSSEEKKKKKEKKKEKKKDKKKKKDKQEKKEKKEKKEKEKLPLVTPMVPRLGPVEERERLFRGKAPAPEQNRLNQAKARLDALRAQQQRPEASVGYTVRKPNW